MIDENLAFRLEQDHSWEALHSLVLSWPESFQKRWYLGNIFLLGFEDYSQAIEAYSSLIYSRSCPIEVHLRLGKALHGADRVHEALACYLRVMVKLRVRRDSWFEHAVYAYGLASLELGLYDHWLNVWARLEEDKAVLRKGAYLASLAHLSLQHWSVGWTLFENRSDWFPAAGVQLSLPAWRPGLEVDGASILITSEMGLGDFLFFLRFVPMLRS